MDWMRAMKIAWSSLRRWHYEEHGSSLWRVSVPMQFPTTTYFSQTAANLCFVAAYNLFVHERTSPHTTCTYLSVSKWFFFINDDGKHSDDIWTVHVDSSIFHTVRICITVDVPGV